MKEKSIAKKVSAKKLKKARGGLALPRKIIIPPVTEHVTYPGPGRSGGHRNDPGTGNDPGSDNE